MDQIKARNLEDYQRSVKQEVKNFKRDNNGVEPNEEELKKIKDTEHAMIYKDSSITIRNRLKELEKLKLTKTQEQLLKKLMDFNTLWQYDSLAIKKSVYELYFDWNLKRQQKDEEKKKVATIEGQEAVGEQNDANKDKKDVVSQDDQEGKSQEEVDDKDERRQKQQLRLSTELLEFQERGGFPQVLKDIFNPTDQASMELDSVYQLKQLCKAFYEKKDNLSQELVQSLDALANERPWTIKMKKKHFDTASNNLLTDVEYMRINAERERIKKYQDITKGSAYTYYKILKRLTDEGAKQHKEAAQSTRD